MKKTLYQLLTSGLLATLGAACVARADSGDLADQGLDQLMKMEITTASKKEQKLTETASAVYVLSSDDIKRSGATTLPELLLMVPGVSGGAVNQHTAAVGIRGLGGQWSNNLMVLIDGRAVYTRTFSGTYWDAYNIVFEDIDRIEVIRGANAALWGSNAVNGVINIITKPGSATQGTLVRTTLGTEGNYDAAARQGFKLGDTGFGRVYVNGERHGESALYGGGRGEDNWDSRHAGFRGDWDFRSGDRLALQGEAYALDNHSAQLDISQLTTVRITPFTLGLNTSASARGHSLLGSWTHAYALASEWSAQVYWNHAERDEYLSIDEDNVDVDFQHRFQPFAQHDLVWGVNTRYRRDRSEATAFIRFDPADAHDTHSSVFFQDEIALADDTYRLTVGSRLEHDPFNGWELQPNLRALWNLSDRQKLWAAVSRSARTPSRADRDVVTAIPLTINIPPYGDVPTVLALRGNKDFKTETMLSYELGYRARPRDNLSVDIVLFHNRYRDLRSLGLGPVSFGPTGVTAEIPINNTMRATTWGGELVVNWAPQTDWRLQLSWSELHVVVRDPGSVLDTGYGAAGASPRHQAGLRSDWDFAPRWSLDVQLKYVDALRAPYNQPLLRGGSIPAYTDVDLRIAWRATPHLELALLGKNLFEGSRLEFSSESGAALTETRQAAYLRAAWTY